jgi:hypothetical protein
VERGRVSDIHDINDILIIISTNKITSVNSGLLAEQTGKDTIQLEMVPFDPYDLIYESYWTLVFAS